MRGRSARGSLSQPRVMAAVRRFCELVVGEGGEQVVDQVVAAQRGLHLRVEALPARGGALLDGHHGLDGDVAQGGIGIVEVRQQRRQRLAAGQPAQGLDHGRAQQLVVEQLQQGRRGPRVADLGQGVDGRVLQPGLAAQDRPPAAGTARASPIWPRLAAAAWRTLTSGSREGGDQRLHRPPPRGARPA